MKDVYFFVICITIITIIAAILTVRKKGGMYCEYDERQELARGKAFRAAYFTLIIYFTISELITDSLNKEWCNDLSNLGYGVCLSAAVFAMVCIMKDAYVGFNQNAIRNVVILVSIGIFNVLLGISSFIHKHDYVTDDVLVSIPINLPIGVLLIAVALTLFIKSQHDKNEAE